VGYPNPVCDQRSGGSRGCVMSIPVQIDRAVYEALQHDPFYGPAAVEMVEQNRWVVVDVVATARQEKE
jgi:hypothetical protein